MSKVIIDGLRHGNAVPAACKSNQGDLDRPLSKNGERQALARRRILGNPQYDGVFATTALRTRMTAAIIANIPLEAVVVIPEISMEVNSRRGKALDTMFGELGYKPLVEWYGHRNRRYVIAHAKKGMAAIEKAVGLLGNHDCRVLVVGHSYSICACVHRALRCVDDSLIKDPLQNLTEMEIGEAEGFRLIYIDGAARYLETLPRLPVE